MLIPLILIASTFASAPTFEIGMLDDGARSGRLVAIHDGQVVLEADGKESSLAIDSVLALTQKAAPKKSTPGEHTLRVELTDGSSLLVDSFLASADGAKIRSLADREATIPLAAVQSMRSVAPAANQEALEAEWKRIASREYDSDILVIRNGDQLEYHQGIVREVREDAVQFRIDEDDVAVKRAKVFGMILRHPNSDSTPKLLGKLFLSDGSAWSVKELRFDGKFAWTTPTGVPFEATPENVLSIDFSAGKLLYLSDVKPESVKTSGYFSASFPTPAVEGRYAPRFNENFESKPLRLAKKTFAKGAAFRGGTEIVYRTPENFPRFEAVVGIDDSVRPQGRVELVISGDDKPLLKKTIDGDDAPASISVDLTDFRRFKIAVRFVEPYRPGDFLILGDARFVAKANPSMAKGKGDDKKSEPAKPDAPSTNAADSEKK